MKKFLTIALVLMFVLCFLPGIAPTMTAYATDNSNPSSSPTSEGSDTNEPDTNEPSPSDPDGGTGTDGEGVPGVADEEVEPVFVPDAPWKLVWGRSEENLVTVSAVTYVAPESDDGVIVYEPGSWLLDQMLNKLDASDAQYRYLELTAGSFGPITAPSVATYSGGEAGEPVYSALFNLPAQDEGRSFPDDGIVLVIKFPGDITVSVSGQQAASVLSAIDLKIYGDRLVVELVGAEDAEAYIEVPCTGTPLWIDAEGNEVEAEYEETDGGFKVAVKSGLTLVFKA